MPLIDGVTVSGLQRLTKLSEWGHEVIFFCPDYSSLEADYPNWREYTGNILPGVKVINLPSDSLKETRGLSILEAFAAGIPILAPNSGGVVENIQSGNNGFLYLPGDHRDFNCKLKTLVENKSLRAAMGDRASYSIQQYSWVQAVQNLIDIWQEEIKKKSTKKQIQFTTQATVNR